MAALKESGLGDRLFVAGYDLSGDIGSIQKISGGPAPLEVTGIDKSGYERIGGRRDGGLDFTAWFDDQPGQAHPRLGSLPTTDQIVTYFHGATQGNTCASLVAKQVNYDGNRAADGAFTRSQCSPLQHDTLAAFCFVGCPRKNSERALRRID